MSKERKQLKMRYVLLDILCILLLFTAALFAYAVNWMFRTWNHLTIDELQFHLQAPLEGTNKTIVRHFMLSCLLPAGIIAGVTVVLLVAVLCLRKILLYKCLMLLIVGVAAGTIGITGTRLWKELDFASYLDSQGQYSELIDEFYVSPDTVQIDFPEKKRNLVYIYLESMETSFADVSNGGGFQENYIPELTSLAQKNEDFSGTGEALKGAYEIPGTGYTMGSIFGQMSGVPLKLSFDVNLLTRGENIFPDMITLGDILSKEGYQQVFILGSEAAFAAKDTFFEQHGAFEILDYKAALEQKLLPEDYKVWWGYEDRRSFAFAKEKILDLDKSGHPFNVTILTVDTHFEDGYVCPLCQSEWGDNQYANVISCASRQAEEFVAWLQKQDFYENTTIVLAGDHITMDFDFCLELPDTYERCSYTAYINSAVSVESEEAREYSVIDFFPTTLASLGADIEGNRLGLGTNLFSYEQTIIERFGLETVQNELVKKSLFMENMEK